MKFLRKSHTRNNFDTINNNYYGELKLTVQIQIYFFGLLAVVEVTINDDVNKRRILLMYFFLVHKPTLLSN